MWYKYPDIVPNQDGIYITYDGNDYEFTRWVNDHWRSLDCQNVMIVYWMSIPPIPKD